MAFDNRHEGEYVYGSPDGDLRYWYFLGGGTFQEGGTSQSIFRRTPELEAVLVECEENPQAMVDFINNPEALARANVEFNKERWQDSGLGERAIEIAEAGGQVRHLILGSGSEGFLPEILETYGEIQGLDYMGYKVCLSEISNTQINLLETYYEGLSSDSAKPKIRRMTTAELVDNKGVIFSNDKSFEIVAVEGDMKVTLDIFRESEEDFNGMICPESVFHTGPRDTVFPVDGASEDPPLLSLIGPIIDPHYGLNFSVYEFVLKGGLLGNILGNMISKSPQLQRALSGGLNAVGKALGDRGRKFRDIATNVEGIADQNLTFMMPDRYRSSLEKYLEEGFSKPEAELKILNDELAFTSRFVSEYAETVAIILEAGIEGEMLDDEALYRLGRCGITPEVAEEVRAQWAYSDKLSNYFQMNLRIRPDLDH